MSWMYMEKYALYINSFLSCAFISSVEMMAVFTEFPGVIMGYSVSINVYFLENQYFHYAKNYANEISD